MTKRNSKIEQLENIDFHDGEIMEISINGYDIELVYKDWREKILRLQYKDVIYFSSFLFPGSPEIYIKTESEIINNALKNVKECYGVDSEFTKREFIQMEFLDEGLPLIIVFNDVELVWEP